MASLPWAPWPYPNRTEVLSPAQIERIVQMHKESKHNAIIYVLVVLALYFVALGILVGRYLQNERDLDVVVCLSRVLERCMALCRGGPGPSAAVPGAPGGAAPIGVPVVAALPTDTASPAARKFSLKMTWRGLPPPVIKHPAQRRPPRPRPRPPQTDDESSDAMSSPPYSPAEAAEAFPPGTPSCCSDGESPPGTAMDTMNCIPWGAAAATTGVGESLLAARSVSPTVVSIMVCDLQDLQDTQV